MSVRINSEQAKVLGLAVPNGGRSKYRAKRTEYNGIVYSSKAEAEYAAKLDARVATGQIAWWIGQPKFRLGCAENVYVADFLIAMPTNKPETYVVQAVDVKGVETAKFRRDKRLWRRYGPVSLIVIARDGGYVIHPGHDVEGTP